MRTLSLGYNPGLSSLSFEDSRTQEEFCGDFRFPNPDYEESKAVHAEAEGGRYDVPKWIDFVYRDQEGGLHVPSGLLWSIQGWANDHEVSVQLHDFPEWVTGNPETLEVPDDIIPGITLRDYQVEAVREALKRRRGVWEMGTGSGKSECGMGLLFALEKSTGTFPQTIWLVPDIQAAENALSRLEGRGVSAGLLGKSRRDLDVDVLVAVVNSAFAAIRKNDTEILEGWFESCDVFLIDECHHQATAVTWQYVASMVQAEYRIGLSGTPYKNPAIRDDPSILDPYDSWLIGFTGPTLIHRSPKDLIDQGYLSPGIFVSVYAGRPAKDIWRIEHWDTVYRLGVTENVERTRQISQLSSNLVRMGRKPLVSIEKLNHGRDIQRQLIRHHGVAAACSFGSGAVYLPKWVADEQGFESSPAPVYKMVNKFVKGKRKRVQEKVSEETDIVLVEEELEVDKLLLSGTIDTIIGSRIFDEAVNIPWVTDLINAAGGKASQRLRQKIGRILRTHEGKNAAWFWDFWDTCHPYLLSHSKRRRQIAIDEGYPTVDDWSWSSPLTNHDLSRLKIGDVTVKLKEIEVRVDMTLPVPSEPGYTGVKPAITLRAELEDGDDVNQVARELHAQGLALFLQEAAGQSQWANYAANVTPQAAYEAYMAQFQSTSEGKKE